MAFAVVAALLSLRLVYLQAIAAPDLASKAERARMSYSWDEPRRGTIYDRNGVVLATSVEASTIYVDPAEVDDPDTTAQVLVDVLGGRKSDYLEAVTAGNTRYSEIKEKADAEVGERMEEAVAELTADRRRPRGRVAGHPLQGRMEARVSQRPGGRPGDRRLQPGGGPGQQPRVLHGHIGAGAVLRRHPVRRARPLRAPERGRDGTPIPGGEHEATPAVDGQDIIISVDIELQQYVEDRLQADKEGLTANGGSAVVMDGGTGEIYAAASLPLLDPTTARRSRPAPRSSRWSPTCSSRAPSSSRCPPWPFWSRAP